MLGFERLIKSPSVEHAILAQRTNQEALLQAVKDCPPIKLSVPHPGALEALKFVEDDSVETSLNPSEVEVEVKAIGVAIADSLTVAGRQKNGQLGSECTASSYELEPIPGCRRETMSPLWPLTHVGPLRDHAS